MQGCLDSPLFLPPYSMTIVFNCRVNWHIFTLNTVSIDNVIRRRTSTVLKDVVFFEIVNLNCHIWLYIKNVEMSDC